MKAKRNLVLALAAALLPFVGSSASATLIGTTGPLPTGITRTSGYYTGNGGEFTIGGSGLVLSGYVAGASGTSLNSGAFETFCLETDEYTFGNAGSYLVNDKALLGGYNTNDGDVLSKGAAWLYAQFASKTWEAGTPVYNYTPGSDRNASAGLLQNAIWYLENENTGSSNAFVTAAETEFGSLANARLDNAAGGYGVYVLNTFSKTDLTGYAQDQLYYNPTGLKTPDGGTTLMLLGVALGGISFVRRYVKV